jgi:Na+/melibiose symporter-like transporter
MKQQTPPPGRFTTRFWFGLGQAGEGIKTTALAAVVLFYYAQVLGLDPRLAGLALLLATATDGGRDRSVGAWCDTLRHRWGRRHLPIYASIRIHLAYPLSRSRHAAIQASLARLQTAMAG